MTRAILPRKPHANTRISNSMGAVYELFSAIGLEETVTFGATRQGLSLNPGTWHWYCRMRNDQGYTAVKTPCQYDYFPQCESIYDFVSTDKT